MKKYLVYTLTALFACTVVAIASPDTAALEAREKAAWQAFTDRKADDFKKMYDPNAQSVYPDGVFTVTELVEAMQKWNNMSFAISDYKVTAFGNDTAVSTSVVTLSGTYDGEDQSGKYNAASVWKQQNGEWKLILHTNMRAEAAGDAQKK
jgi:ketosteroid isomerase-like protein